MPAVFAARGAHILASDLDLERATDSGWVATDQHADSLRALNDRGLCEQSEFDRLVEFGEIDMSDFDPLAFGVFDFVWSSCAFEHLGGIDAGLQFVINSVSCLKPGGLAVHTTEFNVASNDSTVIDGGTVIYRQRDLELLADDLRSQGHLVELDSNVARRPSTITSTFRPTHTTHTSSCT